MVKPLLKDRPMKMTVSIPESVHHAIHLLLLDPVRGRAKYGKVSGLVTQLLTEWLNEQRKEYRDGIERTVSGSENEGIEGRGSPERRVFHGSIRPAPDSPNSGAEREEDEDAFEFT